MTTLLHAARLAARRLGFEVHRYNADQSTEARLFAMMQAHQVDLVLDVGANDGGYVKHLRQGGYTGQVISFEPLTQAHAALCRAADADPQWTVAPRCALGNDNTEVDIHIAGNSTSSSLLPMLDAHVDAAPQSAVVATERVPVHRLDDLTLPTLQRAQRPYLKIDTQGYEMPVLQGAQDTLRRCAGVQVELSMQPLYAGQTLYRDVVAWLEAQGFELWHLVPGFFDQHSGRLLQMDGVFFRTAR